MNQEDIQQYEKIERYLRNELSAEELEAFQTELLKDTSLQENVELHKICEEILFCAGVAELQKKLEHQKELYIQKQAQKKLWLGGALIFVGTGIIGSIAYWQSIQPNKLSKDLIQEKAISEYLYNATDTQMTSPQSLTTKREISSSQNYNKNSASISQQNFSKDLFAEPLSTESRPISEPSITSLAESQSTPVLVKPDIPKTENQSTVAQEELTSLREISSSENPLYEPLKSQYREFIFAPLNGEYWEFPVQQEGAQLQIFDKYGVLVYSTTVTGYSYQDRWDGRRTNGEELPLGVYQYRFVLLDRSEQIGSITIVK
ncbi:MAG: gliding motility-associated C-terminal domain-containing protein [Cytophagales bacterium]|nr:gliding motility-associated C-terminal domain-containing protein [Cytophagales bacterium]MDW8383294.1 gliding motility-associated C-terminal domain-containing protein [Flammeovirgaceae bacterium]